MMKGICEKCQIGVKAIPGTTVYCDHNKTGAIFLNMGGLTSWNMLHPIPANAFYVVAATIGIIAPVTEKQVEKIVKVKTSD
jgi:hypothetical protein